MRTPLTYDLWLLILKDSTYKNFGLGQVYATLSDFFPEGAYQGFRNGHGDQTDGPANFDVDDPEDEVGETEILVELECILGNETYSVHTCELFKETPGDIDDVWAEGVGEGWTNGISLNSVLKSLTESLAEQGMG